MSSCGENMQMMLDMDDDDYKKYVVWVWEKYKLLGKDMLSEEANEKIQKTIDRYAPPTKEEFNRRISEKLSILYTELNKIKRGRMVSSIILIVIVVVLFIVIKNFEDGFGFVAVGSIILSSPLWIYAIGSIIKNTKAIKRVNLEITDLEFQKK